MARPRLFERPVAVLTITLPNRVKAAARRAAMAQGITLGQLITSLLQDYLRVRPHYYEDDGDQKKEGGRQ
jgi:hypothetical protein